MAVMKPTATQRRNLPDAAFAAIFETPQGTRRRILPHHINTAKSATDNATVDVPRLRNALARFNQLKGVSSTVKAKALAHVQAHADAILRGRKESKSARTGPMDPLDRLLACLEDAYAGRATAHHFSLDDVLEPTAEELVWAEEMAALVPTTAALSLREGQSLGDLQRDLGDAVRVAWGEAVGEEGYCYVETVYENTLVAYVRPEDAPSSYWMHAWSQDEDGTVTLGMPAKVVPRTVYDPAD